MRALYEGERNEKPSHSKISPEKDINENSWDKIINKDKINNDFKISERINEYKDNNYKIRYNKANKLRLNEQDTNNIVKEHEGLRNVNKKNKFNSIIPNLNSLKECIIRTPIKVLKFILIFKLFYILSTINLNNIVEQSSLENENINNQIDMNSYHFNKTFTIRITGNGRH